MAAVFNTILATEAVIMSSDELLKAIARCRLKELDCVNETSLVWGMLEGGERSKPPVGCEPVPLLAHINITSHKALDTALSQYLHRTKGMRILRLGVAKKNVIVARGGAFTTEVHQTYNWLLGDDLGHTHLYIVDIVSPVKTLQKEVA